MSPTVGRTAPARPSSRVMHAFMKNPLAVSGLHPAALASVRALFEPAGFAVVPGGRTRAPEPHATLEPGDAVSVDVMRGAHPD